VGCANVSDFAFFLKVLENAKYDKGPDFSVMLSIDVACTKTF
jgi:hypothetical protein